MSTTMETTILENIPLVFYSIAVILHSLGIALLTKLKRKRHQDVIIMHLSVTELAMCILDILQNVTMRKDYNTSHMAQIRYLSLLTRKKPMLLVIFWPRSASCFLLLCFSSITFSGDAEKSSFI